jgi:hypothetical protein
LFYHLCSLSLSLYIYLFPSVSLHLVPFLPLTLWILFFIILILQMSLIVMLPYIHVMYFTTYVTLSYQPPPFKTNFNALSSFNLFLSVICNIRDEETTNKKTSLCLLHKINSRVYRKPQCKCQILKLLEENIWKILRCWQFPE